MGNELQRIQEIITFRTQFNGDIEIELDPYTTERINDDDKERDKSEKTFMQFGFLFRYKGWQLALETVGLLKEKYPDIFFTGLCSESPYAKVEHQIYYNELMELASRLNIKENI